MPRMKDRIWENFLISTEKYKGRNRAKCKFCSQIYFGNVSKLKHHISKCPKCPEENKNKNKIENNNSDMLTSESMISNNSSCSSTWSTQKNIMDSFIDRISLEEQDLLNVLFARAIFSSNSPFSLVENTDCLDFYRAIKPAFKPPNRKALSGKYLKREYEKVHNITSQKIGSANSICLLSDSWTDINGNSITNIVLTTPDPLFYKSFEMGLEGHTAQNYCDKWTSVIIEIGPEKIHGLVTDNAHTMKAALALTKEKFPHIITLGCAAHGLNLLSKDYCKLEFIDKIVTRSKQVIQYFNNKHLPHTVFKTLQKERLKNPITLKVPVETRWSTYATCLSSVAVNQEVIQTACFDISLANTFPKHLKKIVVSDESYWDRVNLILKLLQPISHAIKQVEGDGVSIEHTDKILKEMKTKLLEAINQFPINLHKQLEELLSHRLEFISHPAHLAARFLNPKYHADGMNDEEVLRCMDYIEEIGSLMNIDDVTLLTKLATYRSKSDWAKKSIWKTAGNVSLMVWWNGFFSDKNLKKIATMLLSLPATTCSAERNFKCFSNILTKKRNRLTIEKTNSLVYIKFNYKFIRSELQEADKKEREELKKLKKHIFLDAETEKKTEEAGVDEDENEEDETEEEEENEVLVYEESEDESVVMEEENEIMEYADEESAVSRVDFKNEGDFDTEDVKVESELLDKQPQRQAQTHHLVYNNTHKKIIFMDRLVFN